MTMSVDFKKSKLGAWLQLIRPPNLFTVPGDPLSGFLLAGGAAAMWQELLLICAASVFAYIFGLLTNDLADLEEDRRERPQRPLPSGMVNLVAVRIAAVGAGVLALVFSSLNFISFATCLLLILCILLYNCRMKKIRIAGAMMMGFCRVLNIVLGVSLLYPVDRWWMLLFPAIFALGVFLYITGVTIAAKEETKILEKRPGRAFFLLGGLLAYVALFAKVISQNIDGVFVLLCGSLSGISAAIFLVFVYKVFKLFGGVCVPSETQSWIGVLIRNLIFLHAAAVFAGGWLYIGLGLLLCVFLAKRTAKLFYGS